MTTRNFQLTEDQLLALHTAVTLADDRLEDLTSARDFTQSELRGIRVAVDLVNDSLRPVNTSYTPEQLATDGLWEAFWDQTDIDFKTWFEAQENDPDNDPDGWPEFRDAGLAQLPELMEAQEGP